MYYSKENSKYESSSLDPFSDGYKTNLYSHDKESESVRPLIILTKKFLKHCNSESYRNFFQGLLADLTDEDLLGSTSLQPVLSAHQDGYVIIDENITPKEAQYCEIISPAGNYITCKLIKKNGLVFCTLEKESLTYSEVYSELDMDEISTLRVKFLQNIENN